VYGEGIQSGELGWKVGGGAAVDHDVEGPDVEALDVEALGMV
jgi:hypothetical protein